MLEVGERLTGTSANHVHDHRACSPSNRLRVALILTAIILIVELAGGFLANSLALLSDAGHVFTDVIALGLALYASRQAERPATHQKTFGFHRAGILAALANSITLVAIAAAILWEAYRRLSAPETVQGELMLAVAGVGLVVNLLVARYLHAADGDNLNVRGALLHVIGDAIASAGVLIGGVVMIVTGWYYADPILGVLIALIIAFGSWKIIRETVNILMEGAPKGLDLQALLDELRAVPGVRDVHDIHVWSLAAGLHALSGHVIVSDQALSESDLILQGVREVLTSKYNISHCTLQLEHCDCSLACVLAGPV